MTTNHEIKSLTGLRGIAAFLVMFHHFLGYSLGDSRLAVFSVHLYLAVDLFFVLSGFVMAYTYHAMFKDGFSWHAYKVFLGRRVARIYPLYLFASLLCAVLMVFGIIEFKDTGHIGYAIFTNIFLITGWGFGPYIIGGPAWSISTEWAAYVLFPLLITLTLFKPKIWAAITGCVAIGILWYLGSLPDEAYNQFHGRGGPLAIMNPTTIGPVMRCICGFTLGLLAFRATQIDSIMRFANIKFLPEILAFLIIVLLLGRTTDLKIVILCAAFIVTLSLENSWASQILSSKIPYLLGIYSYSLYLMHVPISHMVDALDLSLPAGGVHYEKEIIIFIKVTLSLLLSVVTYKCIENPGRTFFKKLFKS